MKKKQRTDAFRAAFLLVALPLALYTANFGFLSGISNNNAASVESNNDGSPFGEKTRNGAALTTLGNNTRPEGTDDFLTRSGDLIYQSALTTLSCFVTPGCFPRALCKSGHQPQKIKRKKTWEEQPFCVQDLLLEVSKQSAQKPNQKHSSEEMEVQGKPNERPCLVYSFGIHVSIEWETKVANLFGCEVHAFDPTVNHDNNKLPEGLTFHKWGLQGEGTDMSTTNGETYQPTIDPNLLMPLHEIMNRLNHTHRRLDLLMMDCEGCEWGVLKQMACGGDSRMVRQLVLELHFQKKLGLASESDVLIAADALNCLRRDGWAMTSFAGSGCHPADANYTRGVADVLPGPYFLMYASLQRRDASEQEPSLTDLLKTMDGGQWYREFKGRRGRLGFGKQYLNTIRGDHYARYDENTTVVQNAGS